VETIYSPHPVTHDMPGEWPSVATIEERSVPKELTDLLLSRRDRARLLVLPRATPSVLRDDHRLASVPTYTDLDISAMMVLRRAGTNIKTLHDKDERNIVSQFSGDLVVALGLFIGQALAEVEIQRVYEYIRTRITSAHAHLVNANRNDRGVTLAIDVLHG
jgi:hypothetical protein